VMAQKALTDRQGVFPVTEGDRGAGGGFCGHLRGGVAVCLEPSWVGLGFRNPKGVSRSHLWGAPRGSQAFP
jgi:hypothetical protein